MGWSITSRDVDMIWSRVYPRIVALAWRSWKYRPLFEADMAFRKKEIERVGALVQAFSRNGAAASNYVLKLDAHMAVRVRAFRMRRTDFLLTPEGLVLPWPEMDAPISSNRIIEAYQLNGGRLPRKDRVLPDDEQRLVDEIQHKWYRSLLEEADPLEGVALNRMDYRVLWEVLNAEDEPGARAIVAGSGISHQMKQTFKGLIPKIYPRISDGFLERDLQQARQDSHSMMERAYRQDMYFEGRDFQALVSQVDKIIARAWDDEAYRKEYLGEVVHETRVVEDRFESLRGKPPTAPAFEHLNVGVDESPDGDVGVRRRACHLFDKISDISLPECIKISVHKGAYVPRIVVSEPTDGVDWTLELPYPSKPEEHDIFKELMAGRASNPLYTNCPTGDCGFL